jgi:hypothetical protein
MGSLPAAGQRRTRRESVVRFALSGGKFGEAAFATFVLDDLVAHDVILRGKDDVAPVDLGGGDQFAKTIEVAGGEFQEIEMDAFVDGGTGRPMEGLDQFVDDGALVGWKVGMNEFQNRGSEGRFGGVEGGHGSALAGARSNALRFGEGGE